MTQVEGAACKVQELRASSRWEDTGPEVQRDEQPVAHRAYEVDTRNHTREGTFPNQSWPVLAFAAPRRSEEGCECVVDRTCTE